MSKLVKIIRDDFKKVGKGAKYVGLAVKGIGIGMVQGAYTPLLLNTGLRQFAETVTKEDTTEEVIENVAKGTTQIMSTAAIHMPLAIIVGPEYLIAIGATNVIDYVYNAYRRSKKEESKEG